MLVTDYGTARAPERLHQPSQTTDLFGFGQLFMHNPDIFYIL